MLLSSPQLVGGSGISPVEEAAWGWGAWRTPHTQAEGQEGFQEEGHVCERDRLEAWASQRAARGTRLGGDQGLEAEVRGRTWRAIGHGHGCGKARGCDPSGGRFYIPKSDRA